jgi:DNA-binding transcriptional LysR family regulator
MYDPRLETFLHVARCGSFSKASETLYISPTAVIKQINGLEERLGFKLFIRTHRGLILTPAGESLEKDARYIIQYSKDSIQRAEQAMQQTEDVVRIGSSPMTPAQVLVDLWPKLEKMDSHIKFQIIPFENTPENAREILGHLGHNIDVVAGIFDETMLNLRKCRGIELSKVPICCALSLHHPLSRKKFLTIKDMAGERLMLIRKGWNHYVDQLRQDLESHHPEIEIVDFDFYDTEVFNRCDRSNSLLMAVPQWENVHPMLKIIPVKWDYTVPYGLLYGFHPSQPVKRFLQAARKITDGFKKNSVNEKV